MERNKKDFDIDIIGSQEPLTEEELKILSDFIREERANHRRKVIEKAMNKNTVKKETV